MGQSVNTLRGHQGSVNAISFKSGALYSSGDDGTIRLWEYSDAELEFEVGSSPHIPSLLLQKPDFSLPLEGW